jgi:hypothetical protein
LDQAQLWTIKTMDYLAKLERKPDLQAWLYSLAPIFAIAIFSLSSVVWLLKDQTVWPWDQAWYAETALDLRYATTGGFGAWLDGMVNAMGSKPPLLPWLGQAFVPLSHVVGTVEPALLLLNVFCQIATLSLVYQTARSAGAGLGASMVGVVLTGGSSLFIGMTHQFFVEPLQMLCAAALAWTAVNSTRMPKVRVISLLLMLTAISFLTKSSSFTFVVPLMIYVIAALVISREPVKTRATFLDPFAVLLSVLAAGAAIAWYAVNWKAMAQHFANATSTDFALLYGSLGSIPDKLVYWCRALALALSPLPSYALVLTVTIIAGLAISSWRIFKARPSKWLVEAVSSKTLFNVVLLGQIVVTVYGLATQINEESRFLAPTLPIIGILSAWSLGVIARPVLSSGFLILTAANAILSIAYAHHADPFRISPSVWLKPYAVDDNKERLIQIVRMTCPVGNRYVIVGVEYPNFNANSASFYSAQQRRVTGQRCYYTSLGYAESSLQAALKRIDVIKPEFVATIKPERQATTADSFNRVAKPAAEHLRSDPRFAPVPGAPDDVEIYRRRR